MIRLLICTLLLARTVDGLSLPTESKGKLSSIAEGCGESRRTFFSLVASGSAAFVTATTSPQDADAIGPIRLDIVNQKYFAEPCPKDRPIPGQKAMAGMRGLCVTVDAEFTEPAPKDLDKVGVYGFITYGNTGESVLANNPDGSTDAGQFTIVPFVEANQKKIRFDFIAAIPREKSIAEFENGIGPLKFSSLRLVSFPGGQQYGAISPCEMNEFSEECEVWETENGPYKKGNFMIKSNPRTKGN